MKKMTRIISIVLAGVLVLSLLASAVIPFIS